MNPVKFEGNLISGNFIIPKDPTDEFNSVSPADLLDVIGRFQYSYSSVDVAINSAKNSLKEWRNKDYKERKNYIKDALTKAREYRKELVSLISRETGKPHWEAETEFMLAQADIENILNFSEEIVQPKQAANVGDGLTGGYAYRPRGVVAVIGNFSSPMAVTLTMIVPALIMGNTVVFKPSMKVPAVGQLIAKLFSHLPSGVFNMIQGNTEVGRRIVKHPDIDGILFSGSYDAGLEIRRETLSQHWKNFSLETGGKNAMVIMEDADFDIALEHAIISSYMTAGQKNSSTSRCIVHNSLIEKFLEKLHKAAKELTIGHPGENCFMGPMISDEARDQYIKFHGIATREGAECIMRGKTLDNTPKKGYYATPSIYYVDENDFEKIEKSVYQQTEILGPNLCVYGFDSFEEAIKLTNATSYGLVNTIYTKNILSYKNFQDESRSGLIYWNVPTVYYSSAIPYGGIRKSSNNWPRGLFTPYACAYPVSYLKTEVPISDGIPGAKRKV